MFLREWRAEDALDLLQIYSSNADLERQMPRLRSLEDAERFITQAYVPAVDRAAFCLDSGSGVQGCVLIDFTAKDDAGAWDRAWVSYWSVSALRGTGVMKQMVRAVCDWALEEAKASVDSSIDCLVLEEKDSPRLRRLELGYRTNNPASGKVARYAGFVVEGLEREKFLYKGQTYDAVTAARVK
ncbi:MAG: GNAT family protein [Rothia sp. (in: high G+C Gram-positive bacteria)]|nr:GNAT family protein [Rothia sp. (in: high G+C Gram-positive bacteria)]